MTGQDTAELPQDFEWSSVPLSVLGALSMLLGSDMTSNCCCCCCCCCCCLRGVSVFSCFFSIAVRCSFFRIRPSHIVNAPGRPFTPAKSQRPKWRLLAILRYLLSKMSGDMSRKGKRALSKVSGRVSYTKTYQVVVWCASTHMNMAFYGSVLPQGTAPYRTRVFENKNPHRASPYY